MVIYETSLIIFTLNTPLQHANAKASCATVVTCAPFVSKFSCGRSGATAGAAESVTSHPQGRSRVIGHRLSPAFLAAGAAAAADT